MDTILMATDRLFSSMGDTPEMVKHARILAQATSQLVNALKCEAETHEDSEQQKKLLAAAKLLADATARMVEAAKGCASAPEDEVQQQALKAAAEELRSATSQTSASALKRQIFNKLQVWVLSCVPDLPSLRTSFAFLLSISHTAGSQECCFRQYSAD